MKRYKTLLISTLIFFILAPLFSAKPVDALNMEYFPLAPGNSLFYNSTDDNGTWNTKRYIADDWEFLGGPYGTFTVVWTEAHMLPEETEYTWQNHMWLSKTADTVVWWGFEDEYTKYIATKGLYYVTEPVVVGAVHSGETTGTLELKEDNSMMTSVPFSANYTIDAIEDVTVPAGIFEDCIKIHEEEITPDGQISFWVWYAPNIGAVQYYYPQQDNRWDVLISHEIDLENDPWDSWLMPQVPTILLATTLAVSVIIIVLIAYKVMKKRKA
jgi:hypothetical protein